MRDLPELLSATQSALMRHRKIAEVAGESSNNVVRLSRTGLTLLPSVQSHEQKISRGRGEWSARHTNDACPPDALPELWVLGQYLKSFEPQGTQGRTEETHAECGVNAPQETSTQSHGRQRFPSAS